MGIGEAEEVAHIREVASQGHGGESGACPNECHGSYIPILNSSIVYGPYLKKC